MHSELQTILPFVRPVRMATADPDGLRPYQRDAVQAILRELSEVQSTLLVMATGLGKTQTFGAVAKHWPGRVLVLAHRDELIQQAASRLEQMTGETIGIEQAGFWAGSERIVVATVQTLSRERRRERWARDHFSLVIIDEAHHAVASTYERVIEHFGEAKVLGVTATPDRADEKAMGRVFDSVAYVREINDGIADGYLCPIVVRRVHVDSIDLSGVATVAGDLNQGQLDAVMATEENLHGVARPTMDLAGDRQTIVFSTSVENAHRLAEILNRYRKDCAAAVDGETDKDLRRSLLSRHNAGEFQFLCNVGVLTEGYDSPRVSCVAMARPTKSRALYTQCAGRGLRTFPGKADCLLLDFVGNSGRHELVSAVDILGGRYTDEEVERARKIVDEEPGIGAQEALDRAHLLELEAKEIARRAAIKAQVRYRTEDTDAFAVLHIKRDAQEVEWAQRFGAKLASEKQLGTLAKFKVDVPKNCSSRDASKLIGTCIKRMQKGLASYKQAKVLGRYGYDCTRMSFAQASGIIDQLARNGWKNLPRH